MRKPALLAFSLPLAAAGTLAGHAAGYALVGASRPGVHGYLGYAPLFLAICVAALATSLGLRVSGRLQGRPAAWPFAVLPPLAFCTQELVERLAAGLPAHAVFEPAVYAGLAAQVPLAFAAYLGARALLRVADETRNVFAPRLSFGVQLPLLVPAPSPVPRAAALPFGRLGRAPPR